MKPTITIERRVSDWMAFVNDDRGRWACGKTPAEAAVNVLFERHEEIGINIYVTNEGAERNWRDSGLSRWEKPR